jgi:hypothetical protein
MRGEEVQLHSFLKSDKCSASRPSYFNPGEKASVTHTKPCGLQFQSGNFGEQNFLPLPMIVTSYSLDTVLTELLEFLLNIETEIRNEAELGRDL